MMAAGALVLVGACASGATGYDVTYSGSVTETYTCASTSPPAFQLPNDTVVIDVDASGNAIVTLSSCPGDTITGVANGPNEIDLTTTTTGTCSQTDAAGDTIEITSIGGTLTYDGNDLDLNLSETALINGDACSGVASGQLE